MPGVTLADGAGATGLRQPVALPHGAAQTDVHEALRGGGQWSSARQQHPGVPPQQSTHPFEHQTAVEEGEEEAERIGQTHTTDAGSRDVLLEDTTALSC